MFKKKQKAAPAATAEAGDKPAKKRSKLKLALFAIVPVLLAGSGYGAWAMFIAKPKSRSALRKNTPRRRCGKGGGACGGVRRPKPRPPIRWLWPNC
jgi:hypothetical protein